MSEDLPTASGLTKVTVEPTNRIPPMVEVKFHFGQDRRSSVMLRVGASPREVVDKLYAFTLAEGRRQ